MDILKQKPLGPYADSITDVLHQQLRKSIKFSQWAVVHPFYWDEQRNRVGHISTTSLKYRWWALNCWAICLYLGYVTVRFLRSVMIETPDLTATIVSSLIFAYHTMIVLTQTMNWQNRHDFHQLNNFYFDYFIKKCEEPFFGKRNTSPVPVIKLGEYLGITVSYVFPAYGLASLHGVFFPTAIDSLHDIIRPMVATFGFENSTLSIVSNCLVVIAHAWIGFNVGSLLWLFAGAGICQLFLGLAVLKQLRLELFRAIDSTKVLPMVRVYQTTYILLAGSDKCYQIGVWYPLFCSAIVAIFSGVALINFGGLIPSLAVAIGGGVLLFMLITFMFFAGILQASTLLKEEFMRADFTQNTYFRKTFKTLRPSQVTVGGMFPIDKLLVLSIMHIVVNWFSNVLLLTK